MKTIDEIQADSFFSRVDNGELIPIPVDNAPPVDEIDCESTDDIVCPWCGFADVDTSEWFPKIGKHEGEGWCVSCGKPITVTEDVSYSYTTKKGHNNDD